MGEQCQSYTDEIAHEPDRHKQRTTIHFGFLHLFPTSHLFHRIAGWISKPTGVGIASYMFTGYITLIPSILFSKYIMGWPSFFNHKSAIEAGSKTENDGTERNASTTAAGSITALKTLSARSQMHLQQSGGPDSIAPRLMYHVSLFGPGIPGSYWFTHIYLLLSRWNFYLTGRIFVDQLTEQFMSHWIRFGESALLQVRTCWLDDVVDEFARRHGNSSFNVVILGAGYDTRCYRLQSCHEKNARLYEVDAIGTQTIKKNLLKKAKIDCSDVHFVACDFENENWMEVLEKQSHFDKNIPTVFVWEGVSYYLDCDVVKSTVAEVSKCGRGSCIGFDYFDKSCFNETVLKRTKSVGEPWKFGMDFQDVEGFLRDCNESCSLAMQVLDHLRYKELKDRYLAKYVTGQHLGFLEDFGGFLLLGSGL